MKVMNPTPHLDEVQKKLQESAVFERLKLSVEERIEAHENARQLMMDLQEAGKVVDAKPQSPS